MTQKANLQAQEAIQQARELKAIKDFSEIVEMAKLEHCIEQLLDKFSTLEKVDKRKLAIAKTNFEQGVLWLMSSLN